MSWERRPVPDVTPETKRFWRGAAEGRLLLRECTDCGLQYYYPRALCPDCLSDDVEWFEADGTGTLYSYSFAEKPDDWPEPKRPLVVAYVELLEGPRLVTNIVDCDPDDVSIDMPVEVTFVDTRKDGVSVPVFRPHRE